MINADIFAQGADSQYGDAILSISPSRSGNNVRTHTA